MQNIHPWIQEFYFGGCRGNSNNFISYEICAKRCHKEDFQGVQADSGDVLLNDDFRDALDILVKKRRRDRAEGMNQGFMEIEEQRQVGGIVCLNRFCTCTPVQYSTG